jgi:hypothetical protein
MTGSGASMPITKRNADVFDSSDSMFSTPAQVSGLYPQTIDSAGSGDVSASLRDSQESPGQYPWPSTSLAHPTQVLRHVNFCLPHAMHPGVCRSWDQVVDRKGNQGHVTLAPEERYSARWMQKCPCVVWLTNTLAEL